MKKKWIVSILVVVVVAVVGTVVFATDLFRSVELGDYTYRFRGGDGVIAKYGGTETVLEIPESFEWEGETYRVSYIGENAFAEATNLKTVIVGEHVLTVESGAFSGCASLSRVEFLGNAPEMGEGVFEGTPAALKLLYAHDMTGYDENFGYAIEPFYYVEYLDYLSEAGTLPQDDNHYAYGDVIQAMENIGHLERVGHTFKGWTTDPTGEGTVIEAGSEFELTEATAKLYPFWEKNKYKITFETKGGSGVEEVIVEHGDLLKAPQEPTKKGAIFISWTGDENGQKPWKFTTETVTEDLILYAKWLTIPAAPGGTQASADGYDQIKVRWNKTSHATSYAVYRSDGAKGNYTKIGETSSTSYTDKNRPYQTVFYYKVQALASEGSIKAESPMSGYASAKAELIVPPSYSAVRKETQGVSLTWNGTPGAGGYEVYRASSAGGNFELVDRTTSTSYVDSSAKWTEGNFYKVRAYRNVNGTDLYSGHTNVKGFYRVGDQLADYMSSLSNRNSVNAEAKRLRGGHLHNACVYFTAEALRRVGVPIRSSMGSIDYLMPYLSNNGWVKDRDYTQLRKGDICFTTDAAGDPNGRPTHAFIFMGWVTPGDYSMAYICDNQSPYYDDQVLHTRHMLEKHEHNGSEKEAFSFFMRLR
ncbi:InlB B-repeat-containing protein [Alkalibacter rhizosphaerae]|uniref:InlB B-repeat-containing protein n=1 Tax=Alkalibacter rhizosphaerae TaxID=2815577 RepID=A0A975AH68_9FIRM|nr:InlB B-repeat-containing protein [Alkalibacter rhizosphaerae]QSX08137.1 InlB B-repeat-containing protein [Alkalibacter rhizosphaerae]